MVGTTESKGGGFITNSPFKLSDDGKKLQLSDDVRVAPDSKTLTGEGTDPKSVVWPAFLANGQMAANPNAYYPASSVDQTRPKLAEYYWPDKNLDGADSPPTPWHNTIRDLLYFQETDPNDILQGHRSHLNSIETKSIVELEDGRNRILNALAMLDSMHLINTNNRNLMLNWVGSEAESGRVARANYEVMLSNILDVRDTHVRTQKKIQDMARLGEVQTYYKMHYEMKKKILLETILVVLLLVVLYALRKGGFLADELFNLFFVIVLFAYIFFRLSWQIVDFNSRDKRYFDKYDWGTLDGSFNFHEFEDISSNASMHYADVNDCLETFINRLKTATESWNTFEDFICGYTQLAREKMTSTLPTFTKGEVDPPSVLTVSNDKTKLHERFLHVLIYETLAAIFTKDTDCNNALKKMRSTYQFPFAKEYRRSKKADAAKEGDSCEQPSTSAATKGDWVKTCNAMKTYVDLQTYINIKPTVSSRDELKDTALDQMEPKIKEKLKDDHEYVTGVLNKEGEEDVRKLKHDYMRQEIDQWFKLLGTYTKPFAKDIKGLSQTITSATGSGTGTGQYGITSGCNAIPEIDSSTCSG